MSVPEARGRGTLIATVGLPRSGKTTWAMEHGRKFGIPVVNPDAFRLAVHDRAFFAPAEPIVWAMVKTTIRALFLTGYPRVILDATNTTRQRRLEICTRDYDTVFKVIACDAIDCKRRAVRDGREDLLNVIERMVSQYEPLGADEPSF